MKLDEAKKEAKDKQSFVGKEIGSGFFAKSIIPIPTDVTEDELKTFASAYVMTKDIDKAVKLTQTEEKEFEIGVLTSDDNKDEKTGIGLFSTYFP